MLNSKRFRAFAVSALLGCLATPARAADGFNAQFLAPAAAGAGWLTQDNLALSGPLGGAVALTTGYAHNPVSSGSTVVMSDLATANIGFAIHYSRFRLSADLASPLFVRGPGVPSLDIASHPDTITDVRIALDARLWGDVDGPLRLGLGAQLFVPSADRSDYMSDGSYRGQLRVKAAGDVGAVRYAANVGYHVRPLQGDEVVYGAAIGWRLELADALHALVVGPEAFGALNLHSQQAWEALLAARVELANGPSHVLRFKLGAGAGGGDLPGAAQWRVVAGVEVVGLATAATVSGE